MFIFPYKNASASAKALGLGLGAKRIKTANSRFKGSPDKVVINWGSSELPDEVMKCMVINPPAITNVASNKLKFFEAMLHFNENNDDGDWVNIPEFTTDEDQAADWVDMGGIVVARHKLTGNSGEGIELMEGEFDEDAPIAPLYVKYMPKKQEYRVHVANGQVVDLQRKARRHDVADEDVNWRIRNHDNGFIFARNELDVPHSVSRQAVMACKAIGLDFGAVDIIYNERHQSAYVLEINTAPGLTGQTLEGYVERFKNWDAPVVFTPAPAPRPARVRAVFAGSPNMFNLAR
tara:strand:+ start:1152 stop:2024 length:873 start_codon:yes stop_codon:yes gene_type:complete